MMKINILLFILTALLSIHSYAHQNTELLPVPSAGLTLINQATKVKHLAPQTKISFTIWLQLRHQEALKKRAEEVYNPNSPNYHQYLTANLYQQEFAPSKAAQTAVTQFFKEHGMRPLNKGYRIDVTATAAQIERLFHLKMNVYRYHNKLYYSPASAPRLTPMLTQYIAGITGLSTIPEFHANNQSAASTPPLHDIHFLWHSFMPSALPTNISLQGFSGAQLQKTYSLTNIPKINGVEINGAGQTLVIVDNCGANDAKEILSDANKYFKMNGIHPFYRSGPLINFAMINPDGTPYTTCGTNAPFSREVVLDIEASHTIAPGNNTVLVLGNSDQRTTLIDVIHRLINHNYIIAGFANAYVISNSWSGPETSADPVLEGWLATAAAAGISVNFSSGDCGDNTYTTATKCTGTWPSSPKVNYPSSSPYVTAVGATALFVDASYRYAFETVWGAVKSVQGTLSYDGGTGGGISRVYPVNPAPVSWQSSISNFTAGGYGVISSMVNNTRRALPDIAMLGAPQTGLLIIAEGTQVQDGGTSLACPLFSATLVLVNQARALLNKQTPIGHAAPYLYQMNQTLLEQRAINLIVPPAVIISGATPPPTTSIQGTPAPASSFTLDNKTFGWDSSLTVEPENQFWNDAVGVGSPNIPNFVVAMANM